MIREADQRLFNNLKNNQEALEKLLSEVSSEWTYEDGIYRFYHQSFKVFFLQEVTLKIVETLKTLSPHKDGDLQVNDWFLKIINEGTGKQFDINKSNKNWLQETRPIVEAFFHAKFMLETAVACSKNLEEVPEILPFGWATLLYLFNER